MAIQVQQAVVDDEIGETQLLSSSASAPLPIYTHAQIADYLFNGWDGPPRAFDISDGQPISFNVLGLTENGKTFARNALSTWSMQTGIDFEEITGTAELVFTDNGTGATGGHSYFTDGTITDAYVNIGTNWINGDGTRVDSYAFQVYVHEIGHALGLTHGGDYNGFADYGVHNHYLNDSWQATVMSYFSQDANSFIDADYAYVITPMIADILAMQALYGVADLRTGDTVYGYNSTAGGLYDDVTTYSETTTYTIIDTGGLDTLDYSGSSAGLVIDLNPGTISDVEGVKGSLSIAEGTYIENAIGSDYKDVITGNDKANYILAGDQNDIVNGGKGHDKLKGEHGNDVMKGQSGNDKMYGYHGNDFMYGGTGHDYMKGGRHNDKLVGNTGRDTLKGDGGRDRLLGGDGDDKLYGGSGKDTFVFAASGDDDTIYDYQHGLDRLEIKGVVSGFGDLTITDLGDDTLIEFTGNSITLLDTDSSILTAGDFNFV